MTYGRLDVHWPDGPLESYHLDKDNVAIGRSPGNDIVLDTSSISRYHISLSLREEKVFVEDLDSVNGTYVDGRKLDANTPLELHGGEELQLGDIRLIFHPADDAPTLPLTEYDTTRRIEYERPTYRVELTGPDRAVTPGVHVQAFLLIENLGSEEDNYFIELDGVPKEWVRIERVEVTLNPGDQAQITMSFKPARQPDSTPGDYPFTVRVRSKSRPMQTVDASVTLRVLAYKGFGIDLAHRHARSGELLPVYVHNQGSSPLPIRFSGADPASALRFDFSPPSVTLAPGQRLTAHAQIAPRRPLLAGKPQEHPFAVLAHADDPSHFLAPAWGSFTAAPALSGWRLWALVGSGLLALALLLLAALLLLRPAPPPQILAFSASAAEVPRGGQVTLAWEVQDSEALRVELNGAPMDALVQPQDAGYTFTALNSGDMTLTLVARSGDQEARQSLVVTVYEPLALNTFNATPPTLVRYVQQETVLSWDVPGATAVYLTGLEDYGVDPALARSATGTQIVALTPEGSLNVLLRAEGEAGQSLEQALAVNITDPACTVLAADTPVYAGPSPFHTELAQADAGAAVVPDRRDGSGQWLRLVAVGDQRVWMALDGLDCATFDPALLGVDAQPPTAVPTNTPTATATPSATATASPTSTASPMPTLTPSPSPTALPTATPPPTRTPRPAG